MTRDAITWSEASDPDGVTAAELQPKDWALADLLDITVDARHTVENSIGLSVVVDGILISGMAINQQKWRALLVQQLHDAGGSGLDVLADALDRIYGGSMDEADEERERRSSDQLPIPATRYLHLRNARVLTPGSHTDYPLFRISLSDVSAWSMGAHSAR